MKKLISLLMAVCLLLPVIPVLAEDATVISFEAAEVSVPVGRSVNLKPTITPKKNLKLEWSSSDESIATVSARGGVKGIAVGEAVITAKAAEDGSIAATCKVTVVLPVKKIVFAEKKLDLAAGMTLKPGITVEPADATNKALVFTSSNEKVATVDAEGVITAVGKGAAKITAAARDGSNVKAAISVKVAEYDLVFTTPEPQVARYYYRSGRFVVSGKVKTGCVSIPDIRTAMIAMVAGGPASEPFIVTPVKPGTDTITVKAGRTKTVITVYVSPDCFKTEEKEDTGEPKS